MQNTINIQITYKLQLNHQMSGIYVLGKQP